MTMQHSAPLAVRGFVTSPILTQERGQGALGYVLGLRERRLHCCPDGFKCWLGIVPLVDQPGVHGRADVSSERARSAFRHTERSVEKRAKVLVHSLGSSHDR